MLLSSENGLLIVDFGVGLKELKGDNHSKFIPYLPSVGGCWQVTLGGNEVKIPGPQRGEGGEDKCYSSALGPSQAWSQGILIRTWWPSLPAYYRLGSKKGPAMCSGDRLQMF